MTVKKYLGQHFRDLQTRYYHLLISKDQIQLMGNQTNYTKDKDLVNAHNLLNLDFFGEVPLFNIEEVDFPLSTNGIKIVDAKGKRVKLAGGNWSGAHMCRHCVDGLECRPMRDIAMDIRYKFKMNCIRLTYSLQMFFQNKRIPQKYLKANPELIGKTGMEIFDITVQTLTDVGLMVILNNHTSTSQWCCSNQDGDGLWWSRQFPECMFFQCAQVFARRYRNNPRVIGMDLRNQLRKAHDLAASWGDGNPLTDWKRAAKICADKVQDIAPHWLILVSGLDYQLDLTGVHASPLTLKVPNKLVYTGHFYGFSWPQPQVTSWSVVSYDSFKEKLFNTQTSVRGLGVPYFLGEFGNNTRDIPWNYLIKYLKETDIDWTYWALDGFKCEPSQDETFGVFTNDFSEARHPDLLSDMISVGPPPGTVIQKPVLKTQLKPELAMQRQGTEPMLRASYNQNFAMTGANNNLQVPNYVRANQNNNLPKMVILGGTPQTNSHLSRRNQSPQLSQIQPPKYQQQKQTFIQNNNQQRNQQRFQLQAQHPQVQMLRPQQSIRNEQISINQQQTYLPNQTGQNFVRQETIDNRYQQNDRLMKNTISQGKFQDYQQPTYPPYLQGNNRQIYNPAQLGYQPNHGNVLNMTNNSSINFPNNYPGFPQNKR